MQINVLGTNYEMQIVPFDQEKIFQILGAGGVCNQVEKKILICDMHTFPGYEIQTESYINSYMKEIARHELVHAFLIESGLGENALVNTESWAANEEMIDWIAIQLPKIIEAVNIAHTYVEEELEKLKTNKKQDDINVKISKILSIVH